MGELRFARQCGKENGDIHSPTAASCTQRRRETSNMVGLMFFLGWPWVIGAKLFVCADSLGSSGQSNDSGAGFSYQK